MHQVQRRDIKSGNFGNINEWQNKPNNSSLNVVHNRLEIKKRKDSLDEPEDRSIEIIQPEQWTEKEGKKLGEA